MAPNEASARTNAKLLQIKTLLFENEASQQRWWTRYQKSEKFKLMQAAARPRFLHSKSCLTTLRQQLIVDAAERLSEVFLPFGWLFASLIPFAF